MRDKRTRGVYPAMNIECGNQGFGPKGRNRTAQGNALGKRIFDRVSPERAQQEASLRKDKTEAP